MEMKDYYDAMNLIEKIENENAKREAEAELYLLLSRKYRLTESEIKVQLLHLLFDYKLLDFQQ